MPAIRLFLLLLVLGCLTLLLLQNWSPVIPLVFLGGKTLPLPLAVWILFSVVAGAMTSVFITTCFNLSNYFAPSKPRRQEKKVDSPPRSSPPRSSPQSSEANYTTASTTQPKTESTPNDNLDEWESDSSNDDWNFEEDIDRTQKSATQDTVRDNTTYEANTQPNDSYRSSSYSYSYREPSNSGVGKTESIYDADYRVLTPPYQQTKVTENKVTENKDDWGDEDWGFGDDDFEDEGKSNSPHQGR